ncbi:MAG: SH3 domain-containing protein, partial [Myxococcota bacterium]|nr:SH3 domain-containing protein [Myxococcota bacterium]
GGTAPTGAIAPPQLPSAMPVVAADESEALRFVSPLRSLSSLAIAIRELPPDLRGCVRIVPHEEAWAAYALGRCAARVPALIASIAGDAAVIEGAPSASQLDAMLEPALVRTTTRSNVREGASASQPLLRSLPDATLVVALYGAIGAARSEGGGRGTWTRAVAAEGTEGWIASGLLHPWEHCVPSVEAIGGAHVIASWTDVHEGDRDSRGLLLFEPEGVAGDRRSRVRIATTDASCAIAEMIELPRGRDVIEEIIVTRTQREGGHTLVLLGSRDAGPRRADGRMRWSAHALRAPVAAWEIELRTGQNLPDARRDGIAGPYFVGPDREAGFWPLRVRISGGGRTWYRWDGETLVVDRVATRAGDADGSDTPD